MLSIAFVAALLPKFDLSFAPYEYGVFSAYCTKLEDLPPEAFRVYLLKSLRGLLLTLRLYTHSHTAFHFWLRAL